MSPIVGIVVPTLGRRPDYLEQSLKSIRAAGDAYILMVAPKEFDHKPLLTAGLIDEFIPEQTPGLASSINLGIQRLPKEIKYVNWLGDDDLLTPNGLTIALERLQAKDQPVMVFGACDYIDPNNKKIWSNKSGQYAVPLLRFGPDLIPQPGALFTRKAFNQANGLNSKYGWAFDFDLFIKFSKQGKIAYIPQTLSNFRWHPGSLSVHQRKNSVKEASQVRLSHLPKALKPIAQLWEAPVRFATYRAGAKLSIKN